MISKENEKKLKCICGLCLHDMFDSKCLYNKICDKPNPGLEQYKQIIKIIEKEIHLAKLKQAVILKKNSLKKPQTKKKLTKKNSEKSNKKKIVKKNGKK